VQRAIELIGGGGEHIRLQRSKQGFERRRAVTFLLRAGETGIELVKGDFGVVGSARRPLPYVKRLYLLVLGNTVFAECRKILFGLVIAGRKLSARILRRGAEQFSGDHTFQLVGQLRRVAALVVIDRRFVLESFAEQLQRLRVATACSSIFAFDSECILYLVV